MFVNDGSKDQTWSMIKGLCEENSVFAGVNLSRNRGHQNALLAGITIYNVLLMNILSHIPVSRIHRVL